MTPKSPAIYDTHFAHTLSIAMDDFHVALTKRWREKYIEAIKDDSYDYPTHIVAPASPTEQPLWEAHTKAARCHLVFGDCKFVQWVEDGQQGSLSAVQCDGDTGTNGETVEVPGTPADGGGMVEVPPHIRCGIGNNLQLIDQWAYSERDAIYYNIPPFDGHDLHKLESAHEDFLNAGKLLDLNRKPDSEATSFEPAHDSDLLNIVNSLSGEREQHNDFWAGWTGLAADHAKDGFFKTCGPTMDNQSGIIGSLANLYAARGAIIQKCRSNALYAAQASTKACDEKATVKTDHQDAWNELAGIGDAVIIYGAVATEGVGAVVGASLVMASWLGAEFFPSSSKMEYVHEVEDIVRQFDHKINELNDGLLDMEDAYLRKIKQLQSTVAGIKSANLELFDFTAKDPTGDHDKPSGSGAYTADVDSILGISKACFDAGNGYDGVSSLMKKVADADKDLAGADGQHTTADTAVLQMRHQLEGFLSTTTGRYIVAAQEVEQAADGYSQTETDQRDAFNRIMRDWHKDHVGEVHVHGDPNDMAKATKRHG